MDSLHNHKLASPSSDKVIKLNTSGTTLQYGNITPAASPTSDSMPPPPLPHHVSQNRTAGGNPHLGGTHAGTSVQTHISSLGSRSATHSQLRPRGNSLAASHPALYGPRHEAQTAISTVTPIAGPPVNPTKLPAFPAIPASTLVSRHKDFPYGIVDPALNTHANDIGPPSWNRAAAVPWTDCGRSKNFVVSPTCMICLPFGGTVELANYYA